MKRRFVAVLVVVLVVLSLGLTGCNSNTQETAQTDTAADTADTADSNAAAEPETKGKNETDWVAETDTSDLVVDDGVEEGGEYKIAMYWPAPDPFVSGVERGVQAFTKDYGIDVEVVIGTDWTQNVENEKVESLAAQGYDLLLIYPADASGANGLYQELVDNGCYVVSYGAQTEYPSPASFAVATDVEQSAYVSCTELIRMMGDEGKLLNVLEFLGDANTVLRKAGVERAVAEHPNVEIVQEIAGMESANDATQKVSDAIAGLEGNLDAIIATGYTATLGVSSALSDYYANNPGADIIYASGMDTDDVIMEAIQDNTMQQTISQNPFAMGYLSCLLLKHLKDGWVPKGDSYFIDSGLAVIQQENLETWSDDINAVTQELIQKVETEYMEKP